MRLLSKNFLLLKMKSQLKLRTSLLEEFDIRDDEWCGDKQSVKPV
jgi:hypothetical protein